MKFSIIIPVYNVEKYIKKCLESITNQTYSNFEAIIVNDGTKDNSQNIIDEFCKKDSRFKSYIKENGGLSDARNYGVKHATGDYIIFVDSDDYIEKNLLLNLNNIIEQDKIDIIRYNLNVVDEEGNLIKKNDSIKQTGDFIKNILSNRFVEPAWLYAYNKNFYLKNKFSFPKGKIHEDFYLTLLILDKAKSIKILNYNGYNYVQRDSGIMGNSNYEKTKKYVRDFFEHNKYHNKNIKNKYILSYSNRSLIFKLSELNKEDLDDYLNKIKENGVIKKIKALNYKELLVNIYISLFPKQFISKLRKKKVK